MHWPNCGNQCFGKAQLLHGKSARAAAGLQAIVVIRLLHLAATGTAAAAVAGDLHYMGNFFACEQALAVATWPIQSNTTFLGPAMAAFPPQVLSMFFAVAPPAVAGKFPLVFDAACLARCNAASTASATPTSSLG